MKNIIVVAGNNEFSFDLEKEQEIKLLNKRGRKVGDFFASEPEFAKVKSLLTNCIYLENESIFLFGYKIFGSPFMNQKYKDRVKPFQRSEEELEEIWKNVDEDVDIVITHCPPFSLLDKGRSGNHLGSKTIFKHMNRIKPILHIFGHIHVSRGAVCKNGTVYLNAANTGEKKMKNFLQNPPVIFELDRLSD